MMSDSYYLGVLLHYFIAEDPCFGFQYAYAIRELEPYPLQIIRTAPITSIDMEANLLETLFNQYQLGTEITHPDEKYMYLRLFGNRIMPFYDGELIHLPVVLSIQ